MSFNGMENIEESFEKHTYLSFWKLARDIWYFGVFHLLIQ